MKSFKILLIGLAFILCLPSCEFFDLNKEPLDIVSSAAVFKDKMLVEANLAQIYELTLFHYGLYDNPVMWLLEAGMGAEARGFAAGQVPSSFPLTVINENGAGQIDYWPYVNIRNANEFIKGMEDSEFEEEYIAQKIAEVKYLRAHMYFQMVRRYGGVPIIIEPQSVDLPAEELYVSRDSEKAVFEFILSELDAIAAVLPEPEDTEAGRVNKYGALALKSRAMLYAASIARFGQEQLNGLLGIPTNEASKYWQASYDASMAIVNSEKFSLYNKIPDDPAKNFQQLFVENTGNPERIFVKVYDPALGKGQSWNVGAVPAEMAATWGSNYCPFLHVIEEFEYIDGRPGIIDRNLINSNHLFDIDSVFRNRDPRFLATIFFPESKWQGGTVYFHRRTVYNGVNYTSGKIGENWPASALPRNSANTGFLVRKRMDEGEIGPVLGTSDEDYIVFRYGEILLNLAEAAYYLNKPEEAMDRINMIRNRAKMPLRISISEDDIRRERFVELAFEDHKYWDLRRWRIAHDYLNGLQGKGLEYTYNYNEGKYDFILKNGEPSVRVFQERHYYLPLGVNRIADNPNLVENPGY